MLTIFNGYLGFRFSFSLLLLYLLQILVIWRQSYLPPYVLEFSSYWWWWFDFSPQGPLLTPEFFSHYLQWHQLPSILCSFQQLSVDSCFPFLVSTEIPWIHSSVAARPLPELTLAVGTLAFFRCLMEIWHLNQLWQQVQTSSHYGSYLEADSSVGVNQSPNIV